MSRRDAVSFQVLAFALRLSFSLLLSSERFFVSMAASAIRPVAVPPRHGPNLATLCEKGNEKGVRACQEHGLNAKHGWMCIRDDRAAGIGTFVLPLRLPASFSLSSFLLLV